MQHDKPHALTVEHIADTHGFKEAEEYVADLEGAASGNLKTARDGHTILIPQPSNSPLDTLNWSKSRKHIILIVISFAAFLPDYGSATGAVTLLPQAAYVVGIVLFSDYTSDADGLTVSGRYLRIQSTILKSAMFSCLELVVWLLSSSQHGRVVSQSCSTSWFFLLPPQRGVLLRQLSSPSWQLES